MAFQSTLNSGMAYGVIGELSHDSPLRAKPYVLNSTDPANNVIGRVFTRTATEHQVQAGGTGFFAGILANPKVYPDGAELASSLVLPNGTIGEFVEMGEIYVAAPGAAAPEGTAVKYNTTTGVIGFGAPGAGEAAVPNAAVATWDVAGAGLASIKLTN